MAELSPMMCQYNNIKDKYKDYLLFFRLGDFYEMFFEDAKLASKELELTLTGRDCGQEERVPMCGVPYHSCEAYISRLVQKGYKVAICEQMEEASAAKGIVERDVVRIITPGTVIESTMLEDGQNNYLACIITLNDLIGCAFADVSTGEIYFTQIKDNENNIINELAKFSPAEIIVNQKTKQNKGFIDYLNRFANVVITESGDMLSETQVEKIIVDHFEKSIDSLGLSNIIAAKQSLAQILKYLYATQKNGLLQLKKYFCYEENSFLELDAFSRRSLEITETMRNNEKKGSLLNILDKTKTAMGGRFMRASLERPFINPIIINKRLDCVETLYDAQEKRDEISLLLDNIQDLERLMTRMLYNSANAKDIKAVSNTLRKMPGILSVLNTLDNSLIGDIIRDIDPLTKLCDEIDCAITEEPPFSIREGGMIQKGYNSDLDELLEIMHNGKSYISKLEAEEKEKHGIKSLKIGYNRVFGYYIEVSRQYSESVPSNYIRKQTLSNCERYITEELKELEEKILSAQDKSVNLEYDIFNKIKTIVTDKLESIQKTAKAIGYLDFLTSLAQTAYKNKYVKPNVDNSDLIDIVQGRHPVVEKMLTSTVFVPNDAKLNTNDARCQIITGPNMAGKSTYMRQVALIVIMAQIGSFVPAKSAHIGICDRIFTRVGASDDLSSGQSTFMVEMSEVAHILKNATKKSLLIFDEIGRGTSTFDGMSIARAVIEYAADKKKLGARTLFATHYHELIELENTVDGIINFSTAVKKRGDDIVFLRKIVPGGADDSYGIEVAKLAGVPHEVITRAKAVLTQLEAGEKVTTKVRKTLIDDIAPSMTDLDKDEIFLVLKQLDAATLTPIEAINLLFELSKKARNI